MNRKFVVCGVCGLLILVNVEAAGVFEHHCEHVHPETHVAPPLTWVQPAASGVGTPWPSSAYGAR